MGRPLVWARDNNHEFIVCAWQVRRLISGGFDSIHVMSLPFRENIRRPDRDNAIDQFLRDDVTAMEKAAWNEIFTEIPRQLSVEEKCIWLGGLTDVALGSDAFFPFSDSIHRAAASGVNYILEPGGSARDDAVIQAANSYNMTLVFSGLRLFHH